MFATYIESGIRDSNPDKQAASAIVSGLPVTRERTVKASRIGHRLPQV